MSVEKQENHGELPTFDEPAKFHPHADYHHARGEKSILGRMMIRA